jgi:hypothetical protein
VLSAVQDLIQIPEVDGFVFPHRFAPMQWRVRIISIDERSYRRANPGKFQFDPPMSTASDFLAA